MEPFYLFDMRAVTTNKTIERIISPMAAHLCHLMIAAAWERMTNEHLANVEKAAEELAKATEDLAFVARRVAEESSDKLLAREMGPAAESLQAAGKSILLAAQKCHIQPDVQCHQEELLASAKGVLLATVKILQLEDDAVVRRVIQAAHWLQDCLTALEGSGDMPALLAAFQDVSESLLLLNNLTERRIQELRESSTRQHLAQRLQILRKCVPMLHTAKSSHLKHPQDLQVKGSKTYVFSLMGRTIKELTSLLANPTRTRELLERNGLFSQHLHQLMGLLSSPNPTLPDEGEFSILVESVVFHCMLVANSSKPKVQLQLINRCHHLLVLWKSISSHGNTVVELAAQSQVECSLEEKCYAMRVEVMSLDRTALTAVLCQILDTFTDTKEPLNRLMEAALGPTIMPHLPEGQNGFLQKLQPFTAAFFSHAHQMLKASSFVLARCTNIKIIKEMEYCIDSLNRLLATLPLLLTEMSKDPKEIFNLEQLQTFCQRWAWTTESLLEYVDETINLPEFLDLSIQEMNDHREHCEKELESQNSRGFSWHATHLTSRAARVVQVTNRYLDKVRDPIFKNGLLVLVKQLQISICDVRTATSHCLEGISCLQTRNALSKKVKHLTESARNVREGLDASNHPDILSPLREQLRTMDVPGELDCFSALENLELSAPDVLKQSPTENTELVEELLSKQLPLVSCPLEVLPRTGDFPHGQEDLHPVISELITATKTGEMSAINAACSGLLELSNCCADAAEEALAIVQSPLSEKLTQGRKLVLLTPYLIRIAKETTPDPVSRADRLLQTAALLSKGIYETIQCLVAVAGSWYSLVQQLFCTVAPADFQKSKETLDEIIQTFTTLVQLAGDVAHTDSDSELTTVPKIQERFVRVQAKFTSAQRNTKHLLEKALSSDSCHTHQDCLKGTCLLWSVSIQVLLHALDQLLGRDVQFLGELGNMMRHKVRLHNVLVVVSERSLRIQEAARLSCLACCEQSVQRDILVLREDVKVRTEALLQVAEVLSISPVSATNLSIRAELLQRELAVRIKALLLLLTSTNQEYVRAILTVVTLGLSLAPTQGGDRVIVKQTFEKCAGEIMANLQLVRTVTEAVLEKTAQPAARESLRSLVDHLLLLTAEVLGRAGERQDQEPGQLDHAVWEWAAKAHYLVVQLQSVTDMDKATLELVKKCLQTSESQAFSNQGQGTAALSLPRAPSTKCQHLTHRSTATAAWPIPRDSLGLAATEPFTITLLSDSPNHSHATSGKSRQGSAQTALPEVAEKWQDGGTKMSQVIKEMATEASHMAQFLQRKGPIMTKEQLVFCARQMASNGQVFVKFGHMIAKNCLDERCATDLLCVTEQIQTISHQLRMMARVRAATARSKCAAELLVTNAQHLWQVVLQSLKAAEAACVKEMTSPMVKDNKAAYLRIN